MAATLSRILFRFCMAFFQAGTVRSVQLSCWKMVLGIEVVKSCTRSVLTKYTLFTILTVILTNWTYDFLLVKTEKREIDITHFTNKSVEIERDWEASVTPVSLENRTGLGELGKPASLEAERLRLYEEFGYDAMLSDYIPLDRTLADVRDPNCRNRTYLSVLPTASIIIIFHNEHLSVLLRTVYSILRRTPDNLLNEIILVDDCSTLSSLGAALSEHLELHMPQKVRLLRAEPRRLGLMGARMMGARAAVLSSEVLIFLDSHFEMMYNWLPPLLEPIALNPKACTAPMIDIIAYKSFEYRPNPKTRGYFNWRFEYFQFNVKEDHWREAMRPYRDYVMLGGALAIGSDFFWQLGGFDEGMQYWGGEQFEMSFKLWMCGGEVLRVPCARMGHIYRDPDTKGNTNLYGDYGFVERNLVRLIEVWLDAEHREYVFEHMPQLRLVEPGDLTERHAIRERLQCKSFSWLMENIFLEVVEKFPPIEPADFGYGVLESLGAPGLCVDSMGGGRRVGLYPCAANRTNAQTNQWYRFTWRRELRDNSDHCLESDASRSLVTDWSCHLIEGNQKWFYNRFTKWLVQGEAHCMVANAEDRKVHLKVCDTDDVMMRWEMGFVNADRMNELEESVWGRNPGG